MISLVIDLSSMSKSREEKATCEGKFEVQEFGVTFLQQTLSKAQLIEILLLIAFLALGLSL